jgi:hypothetical protein
MKTAEGGLNELSAYDPPYELALGFVGADNLGLRLAKLDRAVPATPAEQVRRLLDPAVAQAATYSALLREGTRDTIELAAAKRAQFLFDKILGEATKDELNPASMAIVLGLIFVQETAIIDRYRVHRYGYDYPTTNSRAYSEHLLGNAAFHVANQFFDRSHLHEALVATNWFEKTVRDNPMEGTEWAHGKFQQFNSHLGNTISLMELLSLQDPAQEETTPMEVSGDELWQSSKELKRYGVKPAIAPSNMPGIHEISVHSGHEINNTLIETSKRLHGYTDPEPTKHTLSGAVAVFNLTNLPLKHSLPKMRLQEINGKAYSAFIDHDDVIDSEKTSAEQRSNSILSTLQLRPDGHLYTMTGVPVKRWAEDLSAADAYEQVRLECLALYYDLVVPVYIHKLATDRISKQHPFPSNAARVKEMVIARKKILYERRDEIITKLEEEKHTNQRRPTNGTTHPVAGHPRELPDNFSASLEARRLALVEDGRILPEFGKTWVRYHDRLGRGQEEVVAVRAVQGVFHDRQARRRHKRPRK